MLLWLAIRCNTDRINYAYANNLGRFETTIDDECTFYLIYKIGLVRDRNISYVSPAHSEIITLPMEYLLGRKEQWTLELIINDQ